MSLHIGVEGRNPFWHTINNLGPRQAVSEIVDRCKGHDRVAHGAVFDNEQCFRNTHKVSIGNFEVIVF